MALKSARNRELKDNGHVNLTEFQQELGWVSGAMLAVVPIGKGVYIAPLPDDAQRRRGGRAATTEAMLLHAMRAMISQRSASSGNRGRQK